MRHRTRKSKPSIKYCTMQSSQVFHLTVCSRESPLTVSLGFLIFCLTVVVFAVVMIYRVAPKYGKKNPLIYLSICSTVGSVSVMSVKAFGIAVKLTLAGNNQFTHPSTYVFIILTAVCILTQMNYFNKALSQFPTSM
jgi:hydrogenase-4 membrane subunit HyfE